MATITPPEHPLPRFLEIHAALEGERRWFQGASALRFAAISAVCCPGDATSIAAGIRTTADAIEGASSWLGPFRSDLRFIAGAMLLLHGGDPAALMDEIKRVQEMFRAQGLRRGGTYEALAALLLWSSRDRQPVQEADVARFQAIYEEMKRFHWWLTGPDDFPACAVLVGRSENPRTIGEGIEGIYNGLHSRGFKKGDPLQTAANILFLAGLPTERITDRYLALAEAFQAVGQKTRVSIYDELALLAFLDHEPGEIVRRVTHAQEVIQDLKPSPGRDIAFNLACSTAFLELVQRGQDLERLSDAKALMDMQAVLQAQAAAAAVAASSAAVAATAASGH